MAEVAERDPVVIRRLILEEFEKVQAQIEANPESWRKLSFEAHKELCTVMGEDFMDYPELEFWFSRFLQGNFDLNYDISSYPKARSLTDLPVEIFEKFGENLELHERMQLRYVSKDIRFQVDDWDLKVDEIWYTDANSWNLKISSNLYDRYYTAQNVKNMLYPRFYRNPMSFLMSVLKHPKLQLKKLKIREPDDDWKEFIKELDESNRKLHVKKIKFTYGICRSKFDMHYMIPGVLEEIKLFLKNPNRKDITEFIESEQCQKAKMVYIESDTIFPEFPWTAFYNCPRFTLRLGVFDSDQSASIPTYVLLGFRGGPAQKLKAQFLKRLMKKAEVQKCVLYISKDRGAQSQILKCFDEPEAMVPNFPSLRRYPIPGTNEFYELEYQDVDYREEFVCLERKQ